MEILFENSYVRSKELAEEFYRYYFFQRKLLIACYTLLLLSFLSNVLMLIFEKTYSLGVLIFVPLFFLFQIYRYFRQVKSMIQRDNEVYGKEISVETVITDEFIQSTASNGAVNKLEYDKIRSAIQTKNLILLKSRANLIYILRKDTFTKGTKDDFIAFLRSKGVKVK